MAFQHSPNKWGVLGHLCLSLLVTKQSLGDTYWVRLVRLWWIRRFLTTVIQGAVGS